ncbi:MAG: DUF3662 domain-containing protein [Pelolinea sp.]|nr:DUF3662 domain-containing protein [Pelolinea sp.]
MKISIQDIDNKLETFFEGKLLSIFNKNPLILLTEELVNSVENNIQVMNGGEIIPNVFSIYVRDKDYFNIDELKEWEYFALHLITEFSEEHSFKLSGPLKIEIISDETIDKEFIVIAKQSASISGDTINISLELTGESNKLIGLDAFLILWNEEIFEISKNITSIGRQDDNDLVIDNLRVSRVHAQIRRIRNGFYVFDTGSTSGTKVNGHTIKQHQLSNGDVIEIADVPLIFSIGESPDEIDHQNTRTKIMKTKEIREDK